MKTNNTRKIMAELVTFTLNDLVAISGELNRAHITRMLPIYIAQGIIAPAGKSKGTDTGFGIMVGVGEALYTYELGSRKNKPL